jgi:hypothetical protein
MLKRSNFSTFAAAPMGFIPNAASPEARAQLGYPPHNPHLALRSPNFANAATRYVVPSLRELSGPVHNPTTAGWCGAKITLGGVGNVPSGLIGGVTGFWTVPSIVNRPGTASGTNSSMSSWIGLGNADAFLTVGVDTSTSGETLAFAELWTPTEANIRDLTGEAFGGIPFTVSWGDTVAAQVELVGASATIQFNNVTQNIAASPVVIHFPGTPEVAAWVVESISPFPQFPDATDSVSPFPFFGKLFFDGAACLVTAEKGGPTGLRAPGGAGVVTEIGAILADSAGNHLAGAGVRSQGLVEVHGIPPGQLDLPGYGTAADFTVTFSP